MSNTLNENWLPAPGYEGFYSVSDHGRVKSEDRRITNAGSGHSYIQPGKMLKLGAVASGHLRVSLSKGSAVRYASVHSLVMAAFAGPCPSGCEICHADGSPRNNNLSNLRYDTRTSNIIDSQRHGTFSEAEVHPVALLTNAQALAIYNAVGVPAIELSATYGVSMAVINQIWRGDSWRSVTGGVPVIGQRGTKTYLRTILTKQQADIAIYRRANRTGRKDGFGIKPTAASFGVDADAIKTLYAAVDGGKVIFYAE